MIDDDALEPELSALLETEAPRLTLPSDVKERAWRALSAPAMPVKIGTSPKQSSPWAKVTGAAGVALALGAAIGWSLGKHAHPSTMGHVVYAEAPSAPAPVFLVPAIPGAAPPGLHVAPKASTATQSAAPKDANGTPESSTMARERLLLDRAHAAMGRGDALAAEKAIVAHEQEFQQGRLVEEREALRVVASALAGRWSDARREARAFETNYPSSMFLMLVRQTMAGAPD